MLRFVSVLHLAFASNVALAQSGFVGTATHHLAFQEVDAASYLPVSNPDGAIGPGEAALINLSISFSPPVGTLITLPPIPSGTTVAALRGGLVEVHASSGSWQQWSLRPGWDNPPFPGYNPAGSPIAFSIGGIIIQQPAEGAETSNPVENIWRGVWQPSTYTNRMEPFYTWHWGASSATTLWLDVPGPPQEYWYGGAHTTFAFTQIPIIPAPGAGALLALFTGAGIVRRRRGNLAHKR